MKTVTLTFKLVSMLLAALLVSVPLANACAEPLCGVPQTEGEPPEDILRLHIIANSDSEEDQRVKLIVRDELLRLERECFLGGTKDETKAGLMENGGEVLRLVERVLRENGFDYGAQLKLGVYDFPDREYAGRLYPAGRYEALRIVLGRGEGHNWWCVMFPPLCLDAAVSSPQYTNEEETLISKKYIIKFKILELISEITK